MLDFIIIGVLCVGAFTFGELSEADNVKDRCIVKYSDMPHNKVVDYCTTVLKFEKDPK